MEQEIKSYYNNIMNYLGQLINKKFRSLKRKVLFGYAFFGLCIVIAFSSNYLSNLTTSLLMAGIIFLLYIILYLMEKSVLKKMGFRNKRDYLKEKLKNALIFNNLFHSKLLESFIASLEKKTNFIIPSFIQIITFISSPILTYLLTDSQEFSKLGNIVFVLLLIIAMILSFTFLVYRFLNSSRKELPIILDELLSECIFREINKKDFLPSNTIFEEKLKEEKSFFQLFNSKSSS